MFTQTFCLPITVYIGFYDQPPSQGSRSLNLIVVAKLSGFSLGLTTRWSLNPMYSILRWVQRPPKVSTVAISLHKGRNQRSLNTRSLCSTKKGPSRRFWSLNTDWPLYPQSQNPMLIVVFIDPKTGRGRSSLAPPPYLIPLSTIVFLSTKLFLV